MKRVQLCWIVHNEAQRDAEAGISQVTDSAGPHCPSGLGQWERAVPVSHMECVERKNVFSFLQLYGFLDHSEIGIRRYLGLRKGKCSLCPFWERCTG